MTIISMVLWYHQKQKRDIEANEQQDAGTGAQVPKIIWVHHILYPGSR